MASVQENGEVLVWRSEEEARANPRKGKTKKGEEKAYDLYRVISPDNQVYWTWQDGYGSALSAVTRFVGWKVSLGQKSVIDLKAALAAATQEEREAILLPYLEAAKAKRSKKTDNPA